MRKSIVGILTALSVAFVLAGCGISRPETIAEVPTTPAQPPTATAQLPTATPEPPTATAQPPTATPEPPTNPSGADAGSAEADEASGGAGESQVFSQALARSEQAMSYRMEMDVTITGAPPELADMLGTGSDQPVSIMKFTGDVNNEDAHVTMSGMFLAFLGIDPDQGLEIMTVAGQSYLQGPIPLLGATEDRWYVADQGEASFTDVASDPDDFFETFQSHDLAEMPFVQTATESLDGQQCEVYSIDQDGLTQLAQDFDLGMSPDDLDTGEIDSAELSMWICDDGYLHKLDFVLEGTAEEMPQQPVTVHVTLHMYDFNSDITIVAPADALPLEQVAFSDPPFDFGNIPGDDSFAVGDTPADLATSDAGTATVFNGGNIRQTPSLQGTVLGQLHAGEAVVLHEKTADGRWYRVTAPEASGWVSVTLLTLDPATATQVPLQEQASAKPHDPADLRATVANGGNVRAFPSLQGLVVDQINAFEEVQLLAKTGNGAWYKITNPRGVTGWVSVTLLTVDPAVAASVPIE